MLRRFRLQILVVLSVLAAGIAPAAAQVVLAEMLADPASDWDGDGEVSSRGDEWVEVFNLGPAAADLSEYAIRDALGDDPQIVLSGTLLPGEAAVFYGSDAVAWQTANGVSITGLSLNNSGDTIWLDRTDPGGGTSPVDVYIYLPHEAVDDRASGRLPDSGQWALFDGLNPYDGDLEPAGTGCIPTPGRMNDCHPLVPLARETWGGVKARYR